MGQYTYTDIGVVVEVALTFDNLPLITKILKTMWNIACDYEIICYCYPYKEADEPNNFLDQICQFIKDNSKDTKEDDKDTYYYCIINYLMNIKDQDEFDYFLKGTKLYENLHLHFVGDIFSTKIRNTNKHDNPDIFKLTDITANEMIVNINNIKEFFMKIGFTDDQLTIGCNISNYH